MSAQTQTSGIPAAVIPWITPPASVTAGQPPPKTMLDCALECIQRGWFVFPLRPKTKDGYYTESWKEDASNSPEQIKKWWTAHPDANIGIHLGKSNLTVLDFDHGTPPSELNLPETLTVSTKRGTHAYFQGVSGQFDMYLNGVGDKLGEIKSAGGYVLAPPSVHPDGPVYTVKSLHGLAPLPEGLTASLRDTKRKTPPTVGGDMIPFGQHDKELFRIACKLRESGISSEDRIYDILVEECEKRCDGYGSDYLEMCRNKAHSAMRYPVGKSAPALIPANSAYCAEKHQSPAPVVAGSTEDDFWTSDALSQPVESSPKPPISTGPPYADDMPDTVLDGRLGEICQRRLLPKFPISYAWPSIIAAGGVMVPQAMQTDEMTSSYTGLVGPMHSGKSQIGAWAIKTLGLPGTCHSEYKAGSAERLLRKINDLKNANRLGDSVLFNLDEWSYLFNKAGIENSSFISFLHTAFYKREQSVAMGRGKDIEVNCAISFIGGIVADEFGRCFGANSMGGLYDRFTFGLCPDKYNFIYYPFEGGAEITKPIKVEVNPEIWDMVKDIRQHNPTIGREAEIAIRAARICASFDGRPVLRAKDCEKPVRAFIEEQSRIRQILQPNPGVTNDAQCANALIEHLKRHAPNRKVITERQVRQGIRKTIDRLGPGCLEYTTKYLARQGVIWYGDIPDGRIYGGRPTRGYQLLETGQVEADEQN